MIKNKTKKFLSGIITMSLTAVICLGTIVPAFAAGTPITGTETSPAQAAITKKLTMPEGTTTPDATFSFNFEGVSVDDNTTTADLETMPAIGPIDITVSSAADTGSTADGVKTIIKESANVLDNITFPHAGVYVYDVTELQTTPVAGTNESYTWSLAKYQITFYVMNGSNGLYVGAIASSIVLDDSGNTGSGDKVDPSPGDPSVTGDYSKMVFTNTYTKNGGGEDPTIPDNHALTVSKVVTGDYADQTKYFPFAVTVTQPSLVTGTSAYKAYVLDSGNTVVTSTDNYAALLTDTYGPYIEFTSGSTLTVNLKHGQKLAFTGGLHIGADYVAVESAVEHYTASAEVVVNGGTPITLSNGSANTLLSTDNRQIGEGINSAAFSNEYRQITPTGVVINSLPFIMILLVAVGALVGSVVVKTRRKNRYI